VNLKLRIMFMDSTLPNAGVLWATRQLSTGNYRVAGYSLLSANSILALAPLRL